MKKKFDITKSDNKVVLHLPATPYVEIKKHVIDYPGEDYLVQIDALQTFFYYNLSENKLYADKADNEKMEKQVEEHEEQTKDMTREERQEYLQGACTNYRIRQEHIVLFDDHNVCDLIKELIEKHSI